MCRITQSFAFYCRQSKTNKQGLSPVELSIDINGERKFLNLPCKFYPTEFNKKRQSPIIKQTIDEWRNKINQVLLDMMQQNIPLTTESLRDYIKCGGVKSYTVEDMFNEYIDILKKRVGVNLSKCVYRKYELVRDLFFTKVDKNKEVSVITNAVISDFYATLNQRYDTSTSAGYMTKLKTFIQFGMDNDKIRINPFQSIKIVKGQKEITYLSEEEIKTLVSTKIESECLQRVLDCFLVMCGTGLSYVDLSTLHKEDIQENNGVFYIKKNRIKTGVEYTSVIFPFAVDILNKYNGEMPVISNQKMNTFLHRIEQLIDFPQPLNCHKARHTYATLQINRGVNITTIAKTMGHSNSKVTSQFYAKLLDTTILDEVSSVFR